MTNDSNHDINETEDELISKAQLALSGCNWVVGECAFKWTSKYAKGRTDADFAKLIGMSGDQIYQRRRVWETFGDVFENYASLKWSHFYVALSWDDAPEAFQWAEENETTVSEMKAWRRALRGEDLTEDAPLDDWGGDPSVSFLPSELTEVKDPSLSPGSPSGSVAGGVSAGDREYAETVSGVARDSSGSEAEYSPYRQGATTPPPEAREDGVGVAVAPKPQVSAEQLFKRMASTMERMNKALTPEVIDDVHNLPEKLRNRFLKALSELNTKTAKL